MISERLTEIFNYCLRQFENGNKIKFKNGLSIFDGDELISSYVFNSLNKNEVIDTNGVYSKRIWTGVSYNNVQDQDLNLAIWHLPASKNDGLKLLFYDIIKPSSNFWALNENENIYLGRFFGIPKNNQPFSRRSKKAVFLFLRNLKRLVKKVGNFNN
jgi:hypothetical protein